MRAWDTETTGVDFYHGAAPFFVTTSDIEGNQIYWEWDVDPLTRMPRIPEGDLDQIEELLASNGKNDDLLILQNPKFDVTGFSRIRASIADNWRWKDTRCTLMAGHALCSNMRKDLTSMCIHYLGLDIEPLEQRMKKAVNDARRLVKRAFPKWQLAKQGLPSMPSAKGGSKKDEKGVESEKPWKFDTWLPKTVARVLKYPKPKENCQHQWSAGNHCNLCGGHQWWVVTREYANADSFTTARLWLVLERLLHQNGLWEIYLERLKLLPVVYKMEKRGVTISKARTDELMGEFKEKSDAAGELCINIAKDMGYELTLPKGGVNNSIRLFMFDGLKVPPIYSKKSKTPEPTLNKDAMEIYRTTLEPRSKGLTFVKKLLGKRKRDTGLSYLSSYVKFWRPWTPIHITDQATGAGWYVLHPSLNPTGTDTLRFSSSNPNSQNVSKQEAECELCEGDGCEACNGTGIAMHSLRYCLGPAPGREWWSIDYENIELRIPAYESGERVMIELFEKPNDPPYFGSYHLMNASIIYPDLFWPLADKKGAFKKKYGSTWYQWCKNFGFAVQYGAMAESGTADRAAHKPGAQRMVQNKLTEHTKLNRKCIDFADKHGYVETIPDKTVNPNRGYRLMCSRSEWGKVSPTIPLSYHVQSTAMQSTSKGMVRCDQRLEQHTATDPRGYFMTMQVHDEIVFDFPFEPNQGNRDKAEEMGRLMSMSGDDIGIPLKVSISYHPDNWAQAA